MADFPYACELLSNRQDHTELDSQCWSQNASKVHSPRCFTPRRSCLKNMNRRGAITGHQDPVLRELREAPTQNLQRGATCISDSPPLPPLSTMLDPCDFKVSLMEQRVNVARYERQDEDVVPLCHRTRLWEGTNHWTTSCQPEGYDGEDEEEEDERRFYVSKPTGFLLHKRPLLACSSSGSRSPRSCGAEMEEVHIHVDQKRRTHSPALRG